VRFTRRGWLIGATASLASASACKSKPGDVAADGTILTPYLAIGEILADDEIDGVAKLGAAVVKASESRAEEPGVVEILAAAGRIGAADISTARLAYRKMSEGVIAWLAAHPDERAGLQLIHCPMAFTNEGAYWVQRGDELRNPYEGAMMLRCGAKVAWDDHRRGAPPVGEAKLEGMDK
jgi:Cu(I)/Ag(I) efflux system membrane fusion protein